MTSLARALLGVPTPLVHALRDVEVPCACPDGRAELDRLLDLTTGARNMRREAAPFSQRWCARCPVIEQCAEAGRVLGARGVWGGAWRPGLAMPRQRREAA